MCYKARLNGDKAARGLVLDEHVDDSTANAKKRKGKVKDVKAVRLSDATIAQYEEILAQVRFPAYVYVAHDRLTPYLQHLLETESS